MISRIVRLPALLRVLRTLNSAPSRTIQARNHIVRVPAIVRVPWFGTYPHYRGHPTVYIHLLTLVFLLGTLDYKALLVIQSFYDKSSWRLLIRRPSQDGSSFLLFPFLFLFLFFSSFFTLIFSRFFFSVSSPCTGTDYFHVFFDFIS